MKKLALFTLLLLATLQARADITVVQNIQSKGNGQDITMKLKGDKARVDIASANVSVIIDVISGDMVTLIHAQKMFMKISGDKAKAMMEMARKNKGDASASSEVPKIVDTGKTEKVGDYNAEIYTADTTGTKCTFWITKDIADYAIIQAQLKKMQSLQDKFGQDKFPDISQIAGVPVKTVIVKNGETTTISLVSLNQNPIADADIQPPADYTEMQMPQMSPQAPASGPAGEPPAPQQ